MSQSTEFRDDSNTAAGTYLVEGPPEYLVYLITERMIPLLYHFKLHYPCDIGF